MDEWRAGPVGLVSHGGASGDLRAVEHLRRVFVELLAVAVRDTVIFPCCRTSSTTTASRSTPRAPAA
ncbi:hypothetical protein ACFYYL_36395 [Actinomadura geliboluensis]|uniref:hypothetical protein n=1 Tax=Actinomadura geliboluensis TaxID=882440 RepID=UPI00369B6A5E